MNYRATVYYLGLICKVISAFLLIPIITAFCFLEWEDSLCFFYTALVYLGVGFALAPKAPKNKKLGSKEGLVIVGISWIVVSLIGALPFLFGGAIPNYFDAVFETISGFTTTGATILDRVEVLPRSMLMWRSLTHWIGGMGILVFILAVLPSSDGSTFQLLKFESPGPQVGKLVSKVRHSAAILYFIYLALTLLETIFLLCGGLSFFDSFNLALSTAGTGGFAVTDASIAAYGSLYVEIVLAVFMLIFSVNFNIYYLLVIGKISIAYKNEELRTYFIYIVVCILAVAVSIVSAVGSFGVALREAVFAVATLGSSTGFTTVDFAQWSEAAKGILTVVSVLGACAGSTGGGLKFSRMMVVVKTAAVNLSESIRPNSVHLVKLNKKALSKRETDGIVGYFLIWILVFAVSVLLLSLLGNTFSVSFYTSLTMFNNMGPNLSVEIGATASYSSFHWSSKLVMMADMLIGRLEIFPILLLFTPKVWSRKF